MGYGFRISYTAYLGFVQTSGIARTLDCIYYTLKDTEHFGNPQATYATCISIALEHENDIRGTFTEMNKLQLFQCTTEGS